jgi:DNA-binding response OmpR family regulator/HPt (histidine-containing phosphotransfer) domain-containing protein
MKKVLIIEDDQLIANIYRNKFRVEGYQVEIAPDGESGLEMMRLFRPDAILLDLILPKMSGVDVIKLVRAELDFARAPIIVFSNTYLTNMIQEAWKAGATKCLSKVNCSPKEVLDIVRQAITNGCGLPQTPATSQAATPKPAPEGSGTPQEDARFLTNLQKSFVDGLPSALAGLRAGLYGLAKAENEAMRLKKIHDLHSLIHELSGNAGMAGCLLIARMSAALEALLKEIYEKPHNINPSTLRTAAAAVDFLNFLFEHGKQPDNQEIPRANILVVDDDPISQRAVVYALEKAQLRPITTVDPNAALEMLTENNFDLVFLDVNMPSMTGFELCSKLRALPRHKKTPVIFVTILSDFDSHTSSKVAGGNDFIVKPFLSTELTIKALMHILRGKLQPAK